MRESKRIVLASLNIGKHAEFVDLFRPYHDISIIFAKDIVRNASKIDAAEKFSTYLENAMAKARISNHACHFPCLADDSGLEVDALAGKPGVFSRRFAEIPAGTLATPAAQDEANRKLLLSELQNKGPSASRSARFVTVLALCMEGITITAQGVLEGTIALEPRGENGFGYDSLFIPKGSQRTFAEMNPSEKNSISHRAKAVHELMSQIKQRNIVFTKP